MGVLLLEFLPVMALVTNLGTFVLQQIRGRRGMRIMTGNAFPTLNSGMHLFLVKTDGFLAVAGKTELVSLFF